jgi:hypothetical protein
MRKILASLAVVAMVCFSFSVSGQEVEISMDHPDRVNAGEEFTVTVTINKGSLTDYSRFSQDLPLGLTATNVSSPNADFSFDNQRIRIIWLKLPDSDVVEVTYNIMVNERLKGSFILGGVFAYVIEDERRFLNFEKTSEITINPSSTLDPALIVDIRDFKPGEEIAPAVPEQEVFAMAIRQTPVLQGTGAYEVHLLISNPAGSKYAKIEETIPSGYIAEEITSHDGIVSFAASTVKFIWMKLPEESEFQVAYRLVPKQNEPQGDMVIEGLLTYTQGNENKLVEVKQVDVVLDDLSGQDKQNLLATGDIPSGARKTGELAQQTAEPVTPPEEVAETVTETAPEPEPRTTDSEPATGSDQMIGNTRVLSGGTGIYFRVQLAAHSKPFNGRSHFRNAGVDQEVMVEQHNGLYKYTAGSFQSYSQAAAYRSQLERLPGVKGSFVVAYRNGQRISVSAARR